MWRRLVQMTSYLSPGVDSFKDFWVFGRESPSGLFCAGAHDDEFCQLGPWGVMERVSFLVCLSRLVHKRTNDFNLRGN